GSTPGTARTRATRPSAPTLAPSPPARGRHGSSPPFCPPDGPARAGRPSGPEPSPPVGVNGEQDLRGRAQGAKAALLMGREAFSGGWRGGVQNLSSGPGSGR